MAANRSICILSETLCRLPTVPRAQVRIVLPVPLKMADHCASTDPASSTWIKCVFWGGPVSTTNAVNAGETRNQFQVVIAGSNGYVNTSLQTPAGYNGGLYLKDMSISAPSDCNGLNTYLGAKMFASGTPFDPDLCAAACTALPTCTFFNTYSAYELAERLCSGYPMR